MFDRTIPELSNSVRTINAEVQAYNEEGVLLDTYSNSDKLISFDLERTGNNNKFFGYGICQKVNIKLLDINRELNFSTSNYFRIVFKVTNRTFSFYPNFYVSEVRRDETTNELSITAYDALYTIIKHTYEEITLTEYSIRNLINEIVSISELTGTRIKAPDAFDTFYENGANFEVSDDFRTILDDIAEVTQTIYYIDFSNSLVFKRLDKDGTAVFNIDKTLYFDLKSKTNRRLVRLTNVTELGDNLTVGLEESGTTQFIRNNGFWSLREDTANLLDEALPRVAGLTINQFECKWRGNFLLELGDKISFTNKENQLINSYLLNDTISYNGSLSEKTEWSYEQNEEETAANPTNLSEVLNQTFAKVDKQAKEISIVASKSDTNSTEIATIKTNTDSISASVESIKKDNEKTLSGMQDNIDEVQKKVSATMTKEDIKLAFDTIKTEGVQQVKTSSGFTFNEDGLTVHKSNSELETTIDNDGMKVKKDGTVMLTANNLGVDAKNLHATTYLIIGTNSRFEDYDGNRTGCFYIGS